MRNAHERCKCKGEEKFIPFVVLQHNAGEIALILASLYCLLISKSLNKMNVYNTVVCQCFRVIETRRIELTVIAALRRGTQIMCFWKLSYILYSRFMHKIDALNEAITVK